MICVIQINLKINIMKRLVILIITFSICLFSSCVSFYTKKIIGNLEERKKFERREAIKVKEIKNAEIESANTESKITGVKVKNADTYREIEKILEQQKIRRQEPIIKNESMGVDYSGLTPRYFDVEKKTVKSNIVKQDFFWLGYLKGYIKGSIEGKGHAINTYNTKLTMNDSEFVNYPKNRLPHVLDYHSLSRIVNSGNLLSKYDFLNLFISVNEQTVKYLNRNLIPTNSFNYRDADFAFSFFERLVIEFDTIFYEKYQVLYQEYYRLENDLEFYNYSSQASIYAFMEIISSYSGAIADAVFTYAKGHPEFASTTDYEVMGRISELLANWVLPEMTIYFNKILLRYDYDRNLFLMTNQLKNMLDSVIIDSKKHCKVVFHKFKPYSGYSKRTRIEIKTIVNRFLHTNDIEVKINHELECIEVFIPNKPKLELAYEGHKLSCGINVFINENLGIVDNSMLDGVLNRHRLNYNKWHRAKKRFRRKALWLIYPIVRRAFEPIISSSPYSCYDVVLHFGHFRKKVITTRCKNNPIS